MAEITGRCQQPGLITFSALVVDESGDATIDFPLYSNRDHTLVGTQRINSDPAGPAVFVSDQFRNQFFVLALVYKAAPAGTPAQPVNSANKDPGNALSGINNMILAMQLAVMNCQLIATTWRALVEIQSARGTILIKIPLFESNVRQFVASCMS